MAQDALARWHELVAQREPAGLDTLLADDVVFHSPILHAPQRGKALATLYLTAAVTVLGNESFHYVREVVGPSDAVLEFVTEVDGVVINGVDMLRWNAAGEVVDFKVMLRPLKAIQLVQQFMARMLETMQPAPR